jgi:hypothetical protein
MRPRGQGTIELGLVAMLVITLLMFGIHFGEVLFLSLKVQEAAVGAQWDTTSAKVHDLPGDFSMAAGAVERTGGTTASRYSDFDGRSSSRSGRRNITQVFTRAGNMRVKCELMPSERPFPANLPARLRNVYQDTGRVTCGAQADIRAWRIPASLLPESEDGFFKEKHLKREWYHACSFGAPFGASCAATPSILLDDWGLSGPAETGECTLLHGCDNEPYKESVRRVYEAGGAAKGEAAIDLALGSVGSSPIDPNRFWFSFRGEESEFLECVPFGDGPNQWETSPGLNSPVVEYDWAYKSRGNCALGRMCEPPPPAPPPPPGPDAPAQGSN